MAGGGVTRPPWILEMKNQQVTTNNNGKSWWKQTAVRLAITIVATAFAVLAAYLGTISELKLAISEKADRRAVERIDLRLAQIEIVLADHLVNKDEFYQLRDELRVRLTRIESELNR
jgi:hypothetical protein